MRQSADPGIERLGIERLGGTGGALASAAGSS
jgi:hypothetical protein